MRRDVVAAFSAEDALVRATTLLSREALDERATHELGDVFCAMTWAAADRGDVLATLEARVLGGTLDREVADFALCAIAQAETDDSQTALVRLAQNAATPRLRAACMRAMHHLEAPSVQTFDHLARAATLSGIEGSTGMLVLGALTGRGADREDPGARLLERQPSFDSPDYELWLAAWGNTDSPRAADIATLGYHRATSTAGCLAALEALRRARGPVADQLLREASAHPSPEVRAEAARISGARGT
ncbi:MAG: hypothetical protein R3F56_21645 [Planctomycetota bacterium]